MSALFVALCAQLAGERYLGRPYLHIGPDNRRSDNVRRRRACWLMARRSLLIYMLVGIFRHHDRYYAPGHGRCTGVPKETGERNGWHYLSGDGTYGLPWLPLNRRLHRRLHSGPALVTGYLSAERAWDRKPLVERSWPMLARQRGPTSYVPALHMAATSTPPRAIWSKDPGVRDSTPSLWATSGEAVPRLPISSSGLEAGGQAQGEKLRRRAG